MKPPSAPPRAATPRESDSPVETRLTEAQLRELTDSLPHLVWTCLAAGPCDYLSRQWVEYTGIPETEQLGYGWLQQLHPDDRTRVQNEWSGTVGQGVSFDIEFRIRRADGAHRWFRTRAIPLRAVSGEIVKWYGSNTDIHEYKTAQAEILNLNETLERRVVERTAELSAANRDLEAFSYSVAHDLRAPLRGMAGFAAVLVDDWGAKLDAEATGYLKKIQENAQGMGRLIDALLALASLGRREVKREPVDLEAIARGITARLAAAEPSPPTKVITSAGLNTLADVTLVSNLLENLIGNAWKFTRKAVSPCVEVGMTEAISPRVFFVRDNGAGFDMAHAKKLFEPFQRLHPHKEYPGTGVGLASARRIVERHGGSLWAEASPGAGATFYFTLAGKP
ncbi:MAG: PAS domain-containing protein [Myxococcaceae bacterium]|nr:PAS domain-containing protein [Myxococcaceae bacterium]